MTKTPIEEFPIDEMEKLLVNYKNTMSQIEAPSELEESLKTALEKRPKRHWQTKGLAVAAAFLIIFLMYSYDAVAYYGKQLLGYEQVISGSLQDLNRLGQGQVINKSYTFSDGTEVTLDKIFFDDNELVALYTEKQGQKPLNYTASVNVGLKGLFRQYFPNSGRGHGNETENQIAWVMSFQPPAALEKWMDFTVQKQIGGSIESGKISFTIERNKAIAYGIKEALNQTIKIYNKQIQFKSLTVTPLSTVIKGSSTNFSPGERLSFDLLVNGNKIERVTSGMSTNGTSTDDFEFQFDGISQANTIEMANIRIIKEQMIDKEIPISAHSKKVEIGTGDVYFSIENVSLKDGKTYLEIRHKNNVEAVFGLFAADKQLTQLSKETLPAAPSQESDITREILEYEGSSDSLKLMVKALEINTPYEGKIQILR